MFTGFLKECVRAKVINNSVQNVGRRAVELKNAMGQHKLHELYKFYQVEKSLAVTLEDTNDITKAPCYRWLFLSIFEGVFEGSIMVKTSAKLGSCSLPEAEIKFCFHRGFARVI